MVQKMIQRFERINFLRGKLKLPGDKSISHRAVMFGAMADGISMLHNCSESEDVSSTINCFEMLGCRFEREGNDVKIFGKGFKNFDEPKKELYAGNSGTTARLISGILAAQNFESVITGDESLSNRPMKRIVEPLRIMGANITAKENGTLPLRIRPSAYLNPVHFKLPIASAQVKSALILSALHLDGESEIIETLPTRNHTEKLLGLKCEDDAEGKKIFVSKKNYPEPFELNIPSDISSAAFFIVTALLTNNSELLLKNVSMNPTRTGIVHILKSMGGRIEIENMIETMGEPVGDLRIYSSQLTNIEIPKEIIPNIIDEIPILSVAGVFAKGNFKITGADELRVKESDRIKSLCENFKKAKLDVFEFDDGFEISGSVCNENVSFESYGDHRIAMAFAVLSMLMKKGGSVSGFDCVAISNPNFKAQIADLR